LPSGRKKEQPIALNGRRIGGEIPKLLKGEGSKVTTEAVN